MSNNKKENVDDKVVFCRRCGRPLRGFASKELGFGPSCYRQWKRERNQQMSLFDTEDSTDGR